MYENGVRLSHALWVKVVQSRRVIWPYQNYNSISKIYPTACVGACGESYMKEVTHFFIVANRMGEI